MGRRARPRAERLHEKLRQIREAYGWTQPELIRRLGLSEELTQSDIGAFERDPEDSHSREPALPHLLRYARLAGVVVDVLIDPELDLPDKLALDPTHGVVKREGKPARKAATSRKGRKAKKTPH